MEQGRLARASAADDRRCLPGAHDERDVAQDGLFGAGIVEAHVAQLEKPALGYVAHRLCRGHDRCVDVENLDDAIGTHRGPRDHHHDEGGHHHRHQDLHEIREEGNHLADLHVAAVDAICAEPHRRDHRGVEYEHDGGEHAGHQAPRPQRNRREIRIRAVKAFDLVRLSYECAHDPDADDLLAQDAVDRVDARLHVAELRHHAYDDHAHGD